MVASVKYKIWKQLEVNTLVFARLLVRVSCAVCPPLGRALPGGGFTMASRLK